MDDYEFYWFNRTGEEMEEVNYQYLRDLENWEEYEKFKNKINNEIFCEDKQDE